MSTFSSVRQDGSAYSFEWEPMTATAASVEGHDGSFCRFCLEKPEKAVGVLIDGVCSRGCVGSVDWINQNSHLLKRKNLQESKKKEVVEVVEEQPLQYDFDPRAQKYFGHDSRVAVMFSELCVAGQNGVLMSDICQTLQTLFNDNERTTRQNVSTKCSKWSKKSSNKYHDEWWLLQGGQPSRGRPKAGETKDRKVFLIFKGDEIPAEAFIPEEKNELPSWLITAIEKV